MKYTGRWKVKKGGKHQMFKWCAYKMPSTTPSYQSSSWIEAMRVCFSIAYKRTVLNSESFG
jgi:hypothetical protein